MCRTLHRGAEIPCARKPTDGAGRSGPTQGTQGIPRCLLKANMFTPTLVRFLLDREIPCVPCASRITPPQCGDFPAQGRNRKHRYPVHRFLVGHDRAPGGHSRWRGWLRVVRGPLYYPLPPENTVQRGGEHGVVRVVRDVLEYPFLYILLTTLSSHCVFSISIIPKYPLPPLPPQKIAIRRRVTVVKDTLSAHLYPLPPPCHHIVAASLAAVGGWVTVGV